MPMITNMTLSEGGGGRSNFNATITNCVIGPGSYYQSALKFGYYIYLYLELTDEEGKVDWYNWKMSSMGRWDPNDITPQTPDGSHHYAWFPCNSVDKSQLCSCCDQQDRPDIIPPGDLIPVEGEKRFDKRSFAYHSATINNALLYMIEDDNYGLLLMDKLVASPFAGCSVYNHAGNRGIPDNTAFSVLRKSLVTGGYAEEAMTHDFRVTLIGLKAHWETLPRPKDWKQGNDILGVQQILGMPGQNGVVVIPPIGMAAAVPSVVAAPAAVVPMAAPVTPVVVAAPLVAQVAPVAAPAVIQPTAAPVAAPIAATVTAPMLAAALGTPAAAPVAATVAPVVDPAVATLALEQTVKEKIEQHVLEQLADPANNGQYNTGQVMAEILTKFLPEEKPVGLALGQQGFITNNPKWTCSDDKKILTPLPMETA